MPRTHAAARTRLLSWIESLKEVEVYALLEDLLDAMGFTSISLTHGSGELGRDFTFMETDRIGRDIWRAIQVKASPLTGSISSSTSLRSAILQCQTALDTPFRTYRGEVVQIREVWLICTRRFSESAKAAAAGAMPANGGVVPIDAVGLADLIMRYRPDFSPGDEVTTDSYLKNLKSACNSAEEYIQSRLRWRFGLDQVFVAPQAGVRIAYPQAVMELRRLSDLTFLNYLRSKAATYFLLAENSLLPGYVRREATVILARCRRLLTDAKVKQWEPGVGNALEDLRTLELLVAASTPPDEKRSRASSRLSGLLAEVNYATIGAALQNASERLALVRPLIDLRNWQGHSLKGSRHQKAYPKEDEKRLRSAARSCLESLEEAYRASSSRMSAATHVTSLIATQIAEGLEAQEAEQLPNHLTALDRIIEAVDRIDHAVRDIYRAAGRRLATETGHDFAACPEDSEDPVLVSESASPNSVAQLSEITSFFQHYGKADLKSRLISLSALGLLERHDRVVIRGELGIGKTTLLKQFAAYRAALSLSDSTQPIPALCALGACRRQPKWSPAAIIRGSAAGEFESVQTTADVVWLLDGFDEIESEDFRRALENWCTIDSERPHKFVMTSRPHALRRYLPDTVPAILLPLSREALRELIWNYFQKDHHAAARLQLILEESEDLLELAANPLIATLMVILAKHVGVEMLPRRKELIYSSVIRLMLGEWDDAKGGPRARNNSFDVRLDILRRLAYEMYSRHRRAMRKDELVDLLCTPSTGLSLTATAALSILEDFVADCVLVPISEDALAFFHFSIQEYCVADEMAMDVFPGRALGAIAEYLRSSGQWWGEPLSFYAGIKRDVSWLVKEIRHCLDGRNVDQRQNLEVLLRRWREVATYSRGTENKIPGLVGAILSDIESSSRSRIY